MRSAVGFRVVIAGVLTLVLTPALNARAAFPGANGVLAFERELPAGSHTQVDVFAMSAAGTGLRRLTNSAEYNEFGPTWNAPGTRIAFWRTPAPFGPGSIWTMNANGGDRRQLTRGIDARDPAWSPSGARITFTLAGSDGFDVWTMRASDGGDRRAV